MSLTTNKDGLILKADGFVKEFKYVDDTKKIVADEFGIEYSIKPLN